MEDQKLAMDAAGWIRELLLSQYEADTNPADTRFKVEFAEDRLNQSEMLLLVAHFESFMKEVHRTFLTVGTADGCKANTDEQIGKKVRRLEHQNIRDRASYFQQNYDISFGSQDDIDALEEISDVRNKISHEFYRKPPSHLEGVEEQPLVSGMLLKKARSLFRLVPEACFEKGIKQYPTHFRRLPVK